MGKVSREGGFIYLHIATNILVEGKQIWAYSSAMREETVTKKSASRKISRRSPCPVACSLDIFGDRWSLLIVRDLILGRSRFKDFIKSPEGIPTNILTDRLKKLLDHGIVKTVPIGKGAKRLGYRLTEKGKALGTTLRAVRNWGLEWEKGTRVGLPTD